MTEKHQLVVADRLEMQFVKVFETEQEAKNYYNLNLKNKYPVKHYQIYIRKVKRG